MSAIPQRLLEISSWPSDVQSLRLTPKEIEQTIKRLEDFVTESFLQLSFGCDEFQMGSSLVGCYASLADSTKVRLLSALVAGLGRAAKLLASSSSNGSVESEPFESIVILVYAAVQAAEKDQLGRSAGTKKPKNDVVEWNHLKITTAQSLKGICSSSALPRLYPTSSELEHLVGLLVRTAHLLVENPENCKIGQLRGLCVEVLAICGTSLPCRNGLQIIITQDLNYLEHLAEFNADVLATMSTQFNNSSLLDNTLLHIGGLRFTQDDAAAAKIICTFVLKLAISDTRDVLRNVSSIADFLDSELYSVRMSMLEVFAILYCHLTLHDERNNQSKAQARSFLAAIEERLRDVNSFVRGKVLHVLAELVQAGALPIAERSRLLPLVVGRVVDKSSNVRRRAIQLLGDFLRKHPFCVDGGELSLQFFEERLEDIDRQLDQLEPAEVKKTMDGSPADDPNTAAEQQERAEPAGEELAKMQTMQNLLLQKRYYGDAIEFVRQIDSVIPILCRLLASNTKTEVFEVMDFFVEAHIYKVQSSEMGIKKMMHLIWEQDLSTEDGTKRSVKEHVLNNYRRVCLEVDARLSAKEKVLAMAQNLIELVKGASASDLASLEQIVAGFMKKEWISDAIIQAIAFALSSKTSATADQQSALILLAMIGAFRPEVIAERVAAILKIGFGSIGQSNPWIAEYACIALRLVSSEDGKVVRLPADNIIFAKLASLVHAAPVKPRWLQVIAQAVKTLYILADQPGVLAAAWIHDLSKSLCSEDDAGRIRSRVLVKLLHVAGHVASAEVGHLNAIEKHWKEGKARTAQQDQDGMEGVTGTEEDDIVDAVGFVRESELLYGAESLLSVLGPLVVTVCTNASIFNDSLVQNVAAMTLAKFMTVSGRFCDEQLPLFLTMLEKSSDPVIRSNLTIAFADLAQAFGRIIDANIVYLFRRLRDPDTLVKRNALLVLTHLTLTGLIKVKGQVGEIAKCILDEDPRVADLARLFFHELASKDNAIYNHIPDIISSLSVDDGGAGEQLSEEDFQTIVGLIFEYIKKERQMEGLLERLCQRFRQCSSIRQSRDLASCLALVNYSSERTIRRLIESLPSYRDKLVDPVVFRHVCGALAKARRGAKAELRAALDEYEQKIVQAAGAETAITESLEEMSLGKDRSKRTGKSAKGRSQTSRSREVVSDAEDDASGGDGRLAQSRGNADERMDIVSGDDDLPPSPRKHTAPPPLTRKKIASTMRRSRRTIRMRMGDSEEDGDGGGGIDDDDDDVY